MNLRPSLLSMVALVLGLPGLCSELSAQALIDRSLPQYSGVIPGPTLPLGVMPEGISVLDDFNRADGALGANWTVVNGAFSIVGNRADGSGGGRAIFNGGVSSIVDMDIAMTGNGVDYVAAVLDQGAGASNIFVKVQNNGGTSLFDRGACYTGNNGSGFGLGFFALTTPFTTAHMRVSVDVARAVTLELTNIDGGPGTQTYVCNGAPAAEGTAIGMGGFAAGLGFIDNFAIDGVGGADLSLTLADAPDPVTAGSNLTYTATVTNIGPSDAQGVNITLPLPAGTSFVSATPSGSGSCNAASPVVCTWAGATIPGGILSVSIVAAVAPATTGTLNATATAASTTTDPVPGNNTASASTTVTVSANLALTFAASTTLTQVNVPVTFTATSTNLGPSDATNVQISITLSPDFRFSTLTASAGAACTAPQIGNSGVITCTWAGATAPNATRTLAVNAYSNTPGNSSILASTSSATTDPVTSNNTLSVVVTVGAPFEPIPSLDLRALMLLGLMIGLVGFVALRRQA